MIGPVQSLVRVLCIGNRNTHTCAILAFVQVTCFAALQQSTLDLLELIYHTAAKRAFQKSNVLIQQSFPSAWLCSAVPWVKARIFNKSFTAGLEGLHTSTPSFRSHSAPQILHLDRTSFQFTQQNLCKAFCTGSPGCHTLLPHCLLF